MTLGRAGELTSPWGQSPKASKSRVGGRAGVVATVELGKAANFLNKYLMMAEQRKVCVCDVASP